MSGHYSCSNYNTKEWLLSTYSKLTLLSISKFDREKKQKGEVSGGLEECLSMLVPSEFSDDNLQRLVGLQWADFVDFLADCHDRKGSAYSAVSSSTAAPPATIADVQGRDSVL